MFGKIANTFFSKIIVSGISFLIAIINAKHFGVEGYGLISLIVLSVTINQIVSGVIGGTSFIYLAPRRPLFELLAPAYSWALFSSLAGTFILRVLNLIPAEYVTAVFLLSVLQALGSLQLNLFIGLEKIKKYNQINTLQVIITLASLLFLVYIPEIKTIQAYIVSMYLGYGYVFAESLRILFPEIKWIPLVNWGNSLKSIFQNSFYIQMATIIHFFNGRLSYYILVIYMDKSSLGIYSMAVAIAEALWLIHRSITTVQYSKVVNSSKSAESQALTLRLAKFSFLITIAGAAFLLLFPSSFFIWLFGIKFGAINHLMIYLLPGIALIANSTLYTHYYAAIGKNHINTIASSIGLVFTVICCYILIPRYHLAGAAISSGISYLATSLFLIYMFKNEAKYNWKDFLISWKDIRQIINTSAGLFTDQKTI